IAVSGLRPRARREGPCLFFFQAEDGIRDRNVTGVQTCALPISFSCSAHSRKTCLPCCSARAPGRSTKARSRQEATPKARRLRSRSEERRVGKECGSRLGGSE